MSPTPAQESSTVELRRPKKRISLAVSAPKSMLVVPWS
jgi:hypothetical protein